MTAVKTERGMSMLLIPRTDDVETKIIKTAYSSAAGTAFVTPSLVQAELTFSALSSSTTSACRDSTLWGSWTRVSRVRPARITHAHCGSCLEQLQPRAMVSARQSAVMLDLAGSSTAVSPRTLDLLSRRRGGGRTSGRFSASRLSSNRSCAPSSRRVRWVRRRSLTLQCSRLWRWARLGSRA